MIATRQTIVPPSTEHLVHDTYSSVNLQFAAYATEKAETHTNKMDKIPALIFFNIFITSVLV